MKKLGNKLILFFSFLVLPASTNFKLEGFSFGNAGGGNAASTKYSVEGSVGEVGSNKIGSSNYDLGAGLMFVQQASSPQPVTLINDGNFYNKLHLTIDNTNSGVGSSTFPYDTRYAVAISKDDFVTTQYVKSDMTVGTSLTSTDYMTYTVLGGSDGSYVIGLDGGTTYKVKVKAMQGQYSESGYSVGTTATTVLPQLSFDIDVAATDIQTDPPYLINFGDLYPGTVTTSTDKIWISMDTNAASGATVFVYGQNGGLKSLSVGYTIATANGDLGILSNGFGVQAVGATQFSGGPMSIDPLYGGGGDVVGVTDTLVRQIFVVNSPVTTGRASFLVKAKSDNDAPAANDYSETLTIIASANF
jgi:hypothetical protein